MSRSGKDATRDRIEAELTGPLQELGFDVEAVEVTPAGRRRVLRVALDKDGGVSLDDVADATREVSRVLDASDVMGEQPYILEVTSRGVDRPLTRPRHWRRNAGRLVAVTLHDGDTVSGRIVSADDAGVVLRPDRPAPGRQRGRPGAGAAPDPGDGERVLSYAAVSRAQVQVELNRPAEEA